MRLVLSLGQLTPAPAPLVALGGRLGTHRVTLVLLAEIGVQVELGVGLGRGRTRYSGRGQLGSDVSVAEEIGHTAGDR